MKHLIDGQLVKGRGELFTVFNPATEEVIAQFPGIDGQPSRASAPGCSLCISGMVPPFS